MKDEVSKGSKEQKNKDIKLGTISKDQGNKDYKEGSVSTKGDLKKSSKDQGSKSSKNESVVAFRKAYHFFKMRLSEKSAFSTDSPKALSNAGFASLGMGMFALFRPAPFFIFYLTDRLIKSSDLVATFQTLIMCIGGIWCGIILFVLMGLGLLQTFSVFNLKRSVLLLHPWGMTLLYLDVFVWLTTAILLHIETSDILFTSTEKIEGIHNPILVFVLIYIDIFLYLVGYWFYATYFIAAELTLIEKFF